MSQSAGSTTTSNRIKKSLFGHFVRDKNFNFQTLSESLSIERKAEVGEKKEEEFVIFCVFIQKTSDVVLQFKYLSKTLLFYHAKVLAKQQQQPKKKKKSHHRSLRRRSNERKVNERAWRCGAVREEEGRRRFIVLRCV